MLENVGSMTFCYTLEDFMSFEIFLFYEISLILLMSIFRTNNIHK